MTASEQTSDSLALALCELAKYYGRSIKPGALVAGLPLVDGRVPVEHVSIAAERAGLTAELATTSILKLQEIDLPTIVVLNDGSAAVLWRVSRGGSGEMSSVSVGTGKSPGEIEERPALEFVQAATGDIIRIRPAEHSAGDGGTSASVPKRNWFFSAFRDSRAIYFQAILATFAINTLALAMPLFSMNVYDRVLPNAAEETLWALGIGVLIAIVFDYIIRTLRAVFVDAASRKADVRLANYIFTQLLGAKFNARSPSIGVRANSMREFETLREFFNSATITAFGDLPFLILFVAVLYMIAGPLAYIVMAAIPIVLLAGWITQKSLDRLIQGAFQETAQKNTVVVETLVGFDDIKTAGAESWAAQKWEKAAAEHIRTGLAIRHRSNLGLHFVHAIQTLTQVVIVLVGFYAVASGDLTMGALIAATILAGRAMAPLAQAATLLARVNQARIAYRSLSEIVSAPQERPEGRSFPGKSDYKGALHFADVTFQYDDDAQPALTNVSFSIKPGERVGLIGGIGSGKTTVLRLMQGHYGATQGRVVLDNVSVTQIDPSVLRSNIGLMLQGSELFQGSIRENITMGDATVTDATIISAARSSGALAWINTLPNGFDTVVQERGRGLSGGQRQSVALARVFLNQPPVLLLDEPTSEMDGRSERNVILALKEQLAKRTLVLVTHRPALLELVDRLIVFDQGKVVHDGSKSEVLARLKAGAAKASEKPSHQTAIDLAKIMKVQRAGKGEVA